MKLSRSVNKVLQEADPELAILVTRTRQLRALTEQFRELLDPALAKHCYIGSLNGEQLTILLDSAAWASKFRFYSQTILSKLKEVDPSLSKVNQIQVKVLNQPHEPEPVPYKRPELNQENAKGLQTLAESVDHEGLQDALSRLARRAKKDDTSQ